MRVFNWNGFQTQLKGDNCNADFQSSHFSFLTFRKLCFVHIYKVYENIRLFTVIKKITYLGQCHLSIHQIFVLDNHTLVSQCPFQKTFCKVILRVDTFFLIAIILWIVLLHLNIVNFSRNTDCLKIWSAHAHCFVQLSYSSFRFLCWHSYMHFCVVHFLFTCDQPCLISNLYTNRISQRIAAFPKALFFRSWQDLHCLSSQL